MNQLDYSQVLFKDKKDITEDFKALFPNALYLGAMSKTNYNESIKILSVLFSYVGIKTLNALPNLKYIVSRSHGTEKINAKLCKERNIKICKVNPFCESTSDYIVDMIKKYNLEEPYCFYGYGSINKMVDQKLHSIYENIITLIKHDTTKEKIFNFFKVTKTIILSVSANETTKNLFNDEMFKKLQPHTKLISISRSSVIDNKALLQAIKENIIDLAIIDTLSIDNREELLETKKVIYTQHTAWCHNLNEKEYPSKVKKVIDSCIENKPLNII